MKPLPLLLAAAALATVVATPVASADHLPPLPEDIDPHEETDYLLNEEIVPLWNKLDPNGEVAEAKAILHGQCTLPWPCDELQKDCPFKFGCY